MPQAKDDVLVGRIRSDLSDPSRVKPRLGNIKKIAGVRPRGKPVWMDTPVAFDLVFGSERAQRFREEVSKTVH